MTQEYESIHGSLLELHIPYGRYTAGTCALDNMYCSGVLRRSRSKKSR